MSQTVTLKINGIEVTVEAGTSLLDAAESIGIDIPTLCHDERVEVYGACGLCVVEDKGSPKLLRACATKAANGMDIDTMSERVISSRQCALDLLLSDHIGDCKAPCSLACPAGTDCQGYVGLIANGEYMEAAKLIRKILPLPSSIGRVCPHPCETACRRELVEEPIAIAALKSFVGDIALESGSSYIPEPAPDTGKRIAVVGGGPGGLTAAYFLRLKGHAVTVYDKMPHMGGMLRYGIPEYRLPKAILDKEIDLIRDIGITFVNNFHIGSDTTLTRLRADFDAVVLAAGAWKSTKMRIDGEDSAGVLGGIDFLRDVALGEPPHIGQRVAVCGGGNTAMDACRTAVRLGADKVYVIYRRTRNEMPAEDIEIEEAEEEGVIFKFLTNPSELLIEDGTLKGVKLQLMELGEPDAGGRRKPVPIEGAFETIDLDTLIIAIGQQTDVCGLEALAMTKWSTVIADEATFMTSEEGIFGIGDVTNNGADIAITAIGEAHKAADVIDTYLKGDAVPYKKPYVVEKEVTAEDFADRPKLARAKMPHTPAEERKHSFCEVNWGYAEDVAKAEGARCLECGCHDFFECKLIAYARDYEVHPAVYEGVNRETRFEIGHPHIGQNSDKCVLCGLCVRVCDEKMGVTALGLVDRGFETVVAPEFRVPLDKTDCVSCGQCVAVCPTGALKERTMFVKNVPVEESSTLTVCPGCEAGCSLDLRSIGQTLTRAVPASEKDILCAQGRFGYAGVHDRDRLLAAAVNRGKDRKETSIPDALNFAAEKLRAVINTYGAQSVAVYVAETMTSEEGTLLKRLAEEVIGTPHLLTFGINKKPVIDYSEKGCSDEVFTRFYGESFHTGANHYGLQALNITKADIPDSVKAVLAFGNELPDTLPPLELLVAQTIKPTEATENADVLLPYALFAETEGSYTNRNGDKRVLRKAVEPKCGIGNAALIQAFIDALIK